MNDNKLLATYSGAGWIYKLYRLIADPTKMNWPVAYLKVSKKYLILRDWPNIDKFFKSESQIKRTFSLLGHTGIKFLDKRSKKSRLFWSAEAEMIVEQLRNLGYRVVKNTTVETTIGFRVKQLGYSIKIFLKSILKPIIRISITTIIILAILALVIEIIATVKRYKELSWNTKVFKECSWLKIIPNQWKCNDNWSSTYRVVSVENEDSSLSLEISRGTLLPLKCDFKFPYSILSRPSQVGLSVPTFCKKGNKIYIVSEWEQDHWEFRLTGLNVQRDLYLKNLYVVGFGYAIPHPFYF